MHKYLFMGNSSRHRMVDGSSVQEELITTKVVSLNPSQARCTTLCDKVCQ